MVRQDFDNESAGSSGDTVALLNNIIISGKRRSWRLESDIEGSKIITCPVERRYEAILLVMDLIKLQILNVKLEETVLDDDYLKRMRDSNERSNEEIRLSEETSERKIKSPGLKPVSLKIPKSLFDVEGIKKEAFRQRKNRDTDPTLYTPPRDPKI